MKLHVAHSNRWFMVSGRVSLTHTHTERARVRTRGATYVIQTKLQSGWIVTVSRCVFSTSISDALALHWFAGTPIEHLFVDGIANCRRRPPSMPKWSAQKKCNVPYPIQIKKKLYKIRNWMRERREKLTRSSVTPFFPLPNCTSAIWTWIL